MKVVQDVRVTLAGILYDAGPEETAILLAVGTGKADESASESAQPKTLLADLFFRVGGAKEYPTDVACCAKLYQAHITAITSGCGEPITVLVWAGRKTVPPTVYSWQGMISRSMR